MPSTLQHSTEAMGKSASDLNPGPTTRPSTVGDTRTVHIKPEPSSEASSVGHSLDRQQSTCSACVPLPALAVLLPPQECRSAKSLIWSFHWQQCSEPSPCTRGQALDDWGQEGQDDGRSGPEPTIGNTLACTVILHGLLDEKPECRQMHLGEWEGRSGSILFCCLVTGIEHIVVEHVLVNRWRTKKTSEKGS